MNIARDGTGYSEGTQQREEIGVAGHMTFRIHMYLTQKPELKHACTHAHTTQSLTYDPLSDRVELLVHKMRETTLLSISS